MPRTKTTQAPNGEGGVYMLKGRGWHYTFTDIDGRRKFRKSKVQTEDAARAELRKALARRDRGETSDGRATLESVMDDWLGSKKVAGCRSRTLEAYRERMRKHILPELGKVRLDKLGPVAVERAYARLIARGTSTTTVRSVHSTLSNVLHYARRHRLCPSIATEFVTPPRKQKFRARVLSVDEAKALVRGVADHRHGGLWTFLLYTGCRFGEAAGLTWRHVDLYAGVADIRQQVSREREEGQPIRYVLTSVKTEATRRTIALSPKVIEVLTRQRELNSELEAAYRSLGHMDPWDHNLVFPSLIGGLLRENHVNTSWHRALLALGVEGAGKGRLRMHDLRHTKATLMSDSGEDTTVIQRTLGHANPHLTSDIYIGNTANALRAAADRFHDMLSD